MSTKSDLLVTYRDTFEEGLMKELEEKARYHHLEAGETMMEVGQSVTHVPLVVSGIMKVSRIDENGNANAGYHENRTRRN
jgi:CRP/FNR family transcriptional regulator